MQQDYRFSIIGYMFSLIVSENFVSTIESLSKACNLPKNQIRKFLAIILSNRILRDHFSIYEDEIVDTKNISLVLDKLDENQPISFIGLEDYLEGFILLPITPVEIGYIKTDYPELIKNHHTAPFEIKTTIDAIPEHILKRQDIIQNAILQKKKIEFKYKSPNYPTNNIKCSPLSIIENLTTHILYLKDTENNYYRIDRIKSLIKILKEDSNIESYSPDPYQKYFWGTEYKDHGEPIHVKIRINPETSNIITKIKSDTLLRSETCILFKDGNYYYYEDDVLGIQDFRRWLRGYGSSIIVIEPQSLIDEIVDGANKTLEYYKILNEKDLSNI